MKCCNKEKFSECRQDFCTYLYNKETGEFLARSCFAWLLLVIFLIVFYITLGAQFYAYMQIYLYCTIGDTPIYNDAQRTLSLRTTPSKVDQDIFWMSDATADKWASEVNKFTEERSEQADRHRRSAGDSNYTVGPAREINNCVDKIKERVPVVFFEYSKLLNFKPKTFANKAEAEQHMESTFGPQAKAFVASRQFSADRVPLHCFGETELDHQLLGSIDFCPGQVGQEGPTKDQLYFTRDKIGIGYMPPVVAANFPNVAPGIPVSVICAIGTVGVTADGDGQVQFHIMKT